MDESKKKVDHQHEQQIVLEKAVAKTLDFFEELGSSIESLPLNTNGHDYMSQPMVRFLKVDSISRGRVTCSFSVLPPFVNYYEGLQGGVVASVAERLATACARTMVGEEKPLFLGEQSIPYLSAASMNAELVADGKNYYKGLHGGAVASIAERLAIACARTIVAEEKPLFLVELSISYLSSAPMNAELNAVGSVVRSGRNLTVVSIEIRLKETKKLLYTAQATFHQLPAAKL
uniref:Thioesterase domain-containing protein n=1 Tax=Chenopodium quinoa TaxID=63459 RepID=A0A803KZ47_CHEQI